MKKQWIAEAVYCIVALACMRICIGGGKEKEREVFGTSVTGTPAIEAGSMPGGPDMAEATSAPVQDAVPAPGETDEQERDGIKTNDSQAAKSPEGKKENEPQTTGEAAKPLGEIGRMPGAIKIKNENYEAYANEKFSWWFKRKTGHSPSGSGEAFPINEYGAYYLDKEVTEEEKVIYITFDCGYENGFTPTILDVLGEKNVKALFFVTKNFITSNPEYVKRMKEEGHLVGNHTVRHLSSPSLTPEELEAELYEVAKTMEELTGYRMDPFFRPPMGEYSERVLKAVQDMGYTSVFWSIAYYDYDVNNQPGKEYVVDHFATYHHNGSIVLMHNTSESNAQALGEVLDLLKEAGYRFGVLPEVTNARE